MNKEQNYMEVTPQKDRSRDLNRLQIFIIGLQHAFTMFGATILVPYLTGVPVSVALFTAGIGTLIFHLMTKMKVPVFLGSSFAYIAPINAVILYYAQNGSAYSSVPEALQAGMAITPDMIGYAMGGLLIAGIVQIGIGILIKFIGVRKFQKIFTPAIAGTMIVLIGLILAPVAISMASVHWGIALISLAAAMIVRLYFKGFNRLVPVIWGIIIGYIIAAILGMVDFAPIASATWIGVPGFVLPRFSLYALTIIVPVVIAPTIEHFGDIFAVSSIVGKKFYEDPGVHRTLMGDGVATTIAAAFGGPANTTYSENTGVLAFTKVFNPWVMRIAAIFAIFLAFIPKVEALVRSIPVPVMGGIQILLFGMIAAVGMRTLIQNKVHVDGKNLVTISVMLVVGLGGAALTAGQVTLEGLGLAALVGLVLNGVFALTKASAE